ncbi:CRAL/TRIO domain-containing protein [Dacryopinax primogenitus]|uniref:CRAL/TRIO domain-containing protein n=1 Tax=Dacryopinax primogenitus (strain DJM 731) TaxID=1858805 RepID=M5G3Y6_DACPD|nr:CRAL/TRIO domain-containing protein [Dacryopinax primogenitus]EJU04966.1 CRAL/TRIO domain-containing protein [Dacryopinax primogenitus]
MVVIHKPFLPPPRPDAVPTLVSEPDQEKYDTLLNHFSDPAFQLQGEKETEKTALTEYEKYWLSKECFLRYLRATKGDVAAAIKRLESTLAWRRSYGFYRPDFAEHVEPEGVTGKCLLLGYDVAGRPGVYLIPSNQNTEASERQLEFTFFVIECAIDLMGPGTENIALLINFGDKGKHPPMWIARKMLGILQGHYPERLGKSFVINIPWYVDMFLKMIWPFVDPVTKGKVHFNPNVIKENLMTPDMLLSEWNGEIQFTYEHSQFWPELLRIVKEYRGANMGRWRTLGAKVGISEWDYKNGSSVLRTFEETEKGQTIEATGGYEDVEREANEELQREMGPEGLVEASA